MPGGSIFNVSIRAVITDNDLEKRPCAAWTDRTGSPTFGLHPLRNRCNPAQRRPSNEKGAGGEWSTHFSLLNGDLSRELIGVWQQFALSNPKAARPYPENPESFPRPAFAAGNLESDQSSLGRKLTRQPHPVNQQPGQQPP
jgi:hypothetical protein